MNQKLAQIISVVFHPLLMPTFLFLTVFLLAPHLGGVEAFGVNFRLYLLGFLFVYTFLLPSAGVYWFKRMGVIESLQMKKRSDRPLPMLLAAIIYFVLAYFLTRQNPVLTPIGNLLFTIALVIVSVGVISFFWQISAHAAGVAGVAGILAKGVAFKGEDLLLYPLLLFILIAGIVLSARLQLNAHTPKQVLFGFLLGLILGFIG